MKHLVAILILSIAGSAVAGIIGSEDPRKIFSPHKNPDGTPVITEKVVSDATHRTWSHLGGGKDSSGTATVIHHPRILVSSGHALFHKVTGEKFKQTYILKDQFGDPYDDTNRIAVDMENSVCRGLANKCWLVLKEPIPNAKPMDVVFQEGDHEYAVEEVLQKYSMERLGHDKMGMASHMSDLHPEEKERISNLKSRGVRLSERDSSKYTAGTNYQNTKSHQSCNIRDKKDEEGVSFIASDCTIRDGASGTVGSIADQARGVLGIMVFVARRELADFEPYDKNHNHAQSVPFDLEDYEIFNNLLSGIRSGAF